MSANCFSVSASASGTRSQTASLAPKRAKSRAVAWPTPATYQHLKVLKDAGLVSVRADGTRRLYQVRAERMAELKTFLDGFWGERLDALRAAVERPRRKR